jgi:hypothetical protein
MAPKVNFNAAGLKKAIVTQAAACIPPESENISTVSPNKKLKKMKSDLLFLMGYSIMKRIYK